MSICRYKSLTKYEKQFEGTDWGEMLFFDGECIDDEMIRNRNKFIEEYEIQRNYRLPQKCIVRSRVYYNKYDKRETVVYSKNDTKDKYMSVDYKEEYVNRKREPLSLISVLVLRESIHKLILENGYKEIYRLHEIKEGMRTYVRVFDGIYGKSSHKHFFNKHVNSRLITRAIEMMGH